MSKKQKAVVTAKAQGAPPAEVANEALQKFNRELVERCHDVYEGNDTWAALSAMSQEAGEPMSADYIRQGSRMLFRAFNAGMVKFDEQAPVAMPVPPAYVNSTIPTESRVGTGQTENTYCVSSRQLQAFFSQSGKLDEERIREFYGIGDEFALSNITYNTWNGQKRDSILDLRQLKVTVKPKTAQDITPADVVRIVEAANINAPSEVRVYPAPEVTPDNEKYANRRAYIIIADAHDGQHAKASVCGLEANKALTRDNLTTMMREIVAENAGRPYDGIEMVFLGDFVHADNCAKTTTKGTPQDCDGSIFEVVTHACELSVELVEIIKQLGVHITYRFVPGNHDKILGYTVAQYTKAYFRNDNSVEFILNESECDATLYGNTIIGFAHGEFPDTRAHNMFMGRYRSMFNRALRAECILGHLHQEKTTNPTGICKVRRVIQAGITEEWTASKQFAHEYMRGIQLLAYDVEKGLKDTQYYYCKH